MSEFQIGLSGCGGGLEAVSSSQLLELAEYAEELGFAGLWLNEEHFQGSIIEVEGRRCLSPLILASAILARTRKLRVGFSVLLLALHHPVRLAEEIATLDVLSDGRVDLGISRGANPRYLSAFSIDPEGVNDRFQATLGVMVRCWDDRPVHLGSNDIPVEPKPVQRPHPPIYMGTYTESTAEWAARSGYHLICHGISNLGHIRGLLNAFSAAGGDLGSVPFGRFVYVSDTDASAKHELWPVIIKLTTRLRGIGIAKRSRFLNESDLDPETFYREMVIAGSPETCAIQISILRNEFNFNYLNALSAFFGFLPLDLLRRSLRLLATEVAPRVSKKDVAPSTSPLASGAGR